MSISENIDHIVTAPHHILLPDNSCFLSAQELVMDILRILAAPDLEVRKKTLNLALDLVSSRNIEEVQSMGGQLLIGYFFKQSVWLC